MTRLDRLAFRAPRSCSYVIHIDPSGAPGRPLEHRHRGGPRATTSSSSTPTNGWPPTHFARLVAVGRPEHLRQHRRPRSRRAPRYRARSALFERSVERTTLAEHACLLPTAALGPTKLFPSCRSCSTTASGFQRAGARTEDQFFYAVLAYARAQIDRNPGRDRPFYFYNRRDDNGHLTSRTHRSRSPRAPVCGPCSIMVEAEIGSGRRPGHGLSAGCSGSSLLSRLQ